MEKNNARAVQNELHRLMMENKNEELYSRLCAGEFAPFGLNAPKAKIDFSAVAPRMLLRWWVLFVLCEADELAASQLLGFSGRFAADIHRQNEVFVCPPKDMRALKILLKDGLPEDVGETIDAFALLDARWQPSVALWRQLCVSGEPFCEAQLAVTAGTLAAFGISPRRRKRVMKLLLDAVIKSPALNQPDTLAALAQKLDFLF